MKERVQPKKFDKEASDRKTNWCGPFAAQRVLESRGVLYTLQELANLLDTNKNGYTDIKEIHRFFEVLRYPVTEKSEATFQNLRDEIANRNAVLVSRMARSKGNKLYEHISAVDLISRNSIVLVEQVGDHSLTGLQFERYDKEAFLKLWYDSLSPGCYLAVGRKRKRRR